MWRFQILGDVLGQPFTLHAKPHEGFQPLQLFGFGADAVLPGCIETVHIHDGELVDTNMAACLAIGSELVLKRQAYGFRNFQNYRLRVRVMCS